MEIKKGKNINFGAACLPVEFLAEKYNFALWLGICQCTDQRLTVYTGQIVSAFQALRFHQQ